MTRWYVAAFIVVFGLHACGGAAADSLDERSTPTTPPRHVIALIDLSGSMKATELQKSQQFIESVVNEVTFGDRLTVMSVLARDGPRDSTAFKWGKTMPPAKKSPPTPADAKRLESARKGANAAIDVAFRNQPQRDRTDLFSTMLSTQDQLRDNPDMRPVIVILSDMLNATEVLDMAKEYTTLPSRLKQFKDSGDIAQLDSACIIVVGAVSKSDVGKAVQRFWNGYFTAANANLSTNDYRYEASNARSFSCFAR